MFAEIGVVVLGVMCAFLIWQDRQIWGRVEHLVEGRRLSTLLKLDSSSFKLDPDRFEPNKQELLTRCVSLVGTKQAAHPSPSTEAYKILDISGLADFLSGGTKGSVQEALARLIANGDQEGQRELLREVVNQM
ncbi:MAG: hypothetical protein WD850_03550 [Candidatus Spechtbacterales bacterium]